MVASPHHSEPAWRCAKFLGASVVGMISSEQVETLGSEIPSFYIFLLIQKTFLQLTAADDPRFIARFWGKKGLHPDVLDARRS
jgi:hypothetical protein